MAAASSVEQKAAAEKAAAEKQAAEEKTQQEAAAKAEADKAAEQEGKAKADAAKGEPATKTKRYVVTGAAVVLPTVDNSERYLYRNAPVDPGAFTPEGIKHAVSLGLVAEVK